MKKLIATLSALTFAAGVLEVVPVVRTENVCD